MNITNDCVVFLPPHFESYELVIFIILNTATTIASCFGNTLVILAVIMYPQLRTRTTCFLLILAISDLLLSLFVQTFASIVVTLPSDNVDRCTFGTVLMYLGMALGGTSGYMLGLISYDRYQHISKLNNYYKYMSERKVKILIILCWLVPAFTGLFIFSKHTAQVFYVIVVIALLTTMTIIGYCYYKSWKLVSAHLIERVHSSPNIMNRKKSKSVREYWRVAKSLLLLVLVYVLTLTPVTIFCLVEEYYYYFHNFDIGTKPITAKFLYFSLLIVFTNACVNPLLYYMKTRELKDGMRAVILRICRCEKRPLLVNARGSISTSTYGQDNQACTEMAART